jgi:PAN domain
MRKALIAALVVGAFIAGHLFPSLKTRSPEYTLVNGQLIRTDPDGTKTPLGPPMGKVAPEENNESVLVEPELLVPAQRPAQSVSVKTETARVPIEQPTEQPLAGQAPLPPSRPTTATVPPSQLPPPAPTPQPPSPVIAMAPVPPGMTDYTTYENRDINSNDIEIVKNVDLSNCISKCRLDTRCRAYSFDKWNEYCFLKSGAGPLMLDPRSVTGVRGDVPTPPISAAPIVMERYRGKAFPGVGYRSISTAFGVCESTCRSEQACIAYTFQKSERTCHLFSTTGKYFANALADSGTKRQER